MRSLRVVFARWFANAFVPAFFPRVNPLVRRILRSRLHPLIDWYVAAVRFQGGRTGKTYEVPFTFHRVPGSPGERRTIECMTNRRGRWWRNLRGGVDASLLVNGRWRPATAEAIEDEPTIAEALARRDWPRRLLMPLPPSDSVLVRVTEHE